MKIKDSGSRTEFTTGAVRDCKDENGRCDLLPIDVIGEMLDDEILEYIGSFVFDGDKTNLECAANTFLANNFESYETGILELSMYYAQGCQKYGERNWEKGIPLHSYIDSAVRHYLKFLRDDADERHEMAFLWNILGALWTLKHKPELNDLPCSKMG